MWGYNGNGALGLGNNADQRLPQRITFPNGVQVVSVDQNGAVWAWGDNGSGQFGNGTTSSTSIPQVIPTLRVSSATSVLSHVIALGADGSVWSWGFNNYGQVGHRTTYHAMPCRVPMPAAASPIVQVTSGWSSSVALDANGAIWTWGSLGANSLANPQDPVVIPTPTLPAGVKPVQVAPGDTLIARLSNGAMLTWKNTNGGQMFSNLILDGHFITSVSGGRGGTALPHARETSQTLKHTRVEGTAG